MTRRRRHKPLDTTRCPACGVSSEGNGSPTTEPSMEEIIRQVGEDFEKMKKEWDQKYGKE